MPKGVGRREVEALLDWDNLVPEAKIRFDGGETPLVFLRSVLDAPRDKQIETIDKLIAAKVKSAAGATRTIRREQEAAAAATTEGQAQPVPKPPRVRPRKFLLAFREALKDVRTKRAVEAVDPERLLAFLLGDDTAIEGFDAVKQAAVDAGWST